MINGCRFELLIVFGGDGTFNEVINGLMRVFVKPKILYKVYDKENKVSSTSRYDFSNIKIFL